MNKNENQDIDTYNDLKKSLKNIIANISFAIYHEYFSHKNIMMISNLT